MKTIQRHPDWFIALAFLLAALALRLPEFMQIPRMSDEGQEALWALDITRGKHFPLTGITPQLGPFLPYLMALVFAIFGPQIVFPRLLTTLLSALIVPLTFWLGNTTWNRKVGAVAALLALACPELIVLGHLGWSASLAPFFAVATFAVLTAGMKMGEPWVVAASGLLMALTIQGHATSAVLLAGVVLWFFTLPNWRALMQRRDVIAALALFVLGCAPQVITWIRIYFDPPAEGISGMLSPTISPTVYVARLVPFVRVGGFFLGGGVGEATILLRVRAIIFELLLLGGILWMWRAKSYLIPFVLVSSVLLLPAFITEVNDRYYLYLFPMAYVPVAMLVEGLWTSRRDRRTPFASPDGNQIGRVAIGLGLPVLIALLILAPLANLAGYYAETLAEQRTNQEYFHLASVVREYQACGNALIVENPPSDFSTLSTIQAWFSLHAIDFVLTFDQCAHSLDSVGLERASWLVISEPSFAKLSTERFEKVAEFSPAAIESLSVKILLMRARQ